MGVCFSYIVGEFVGQIIANDHCVTATLFVSRHRCCNVVIKDISDIDPVGSKITLCRGCCLRTGHGADDGPRKFLRTEDTEAFPDNEDPESCWRGRIDMRRR